MPVIVEPANYGPWLDPAPQDPVKLHRMLKPCPSSKLELIEVSARVNSPTHDGPENIAPLRQ